jgi:hypothetical protein
MDRNLRRPKSRSLRTNRGFIDWRELSMSKLLLAAFNTCLWITLLALVITGIIRVGVEAIERRVQHQAILHSVQSSNR